LDDAEEYDLMSSDARLARIMQEQERLDAIMRREQKRIRRAQRERLQRQQDAIVSVSTGVCEQAAPPDLPLKFQRLIMVALYRADHYIFALWFLSFFFFPRLISAVGDLMSTILPHMVWL